DDQDPPAALRLVVHARQSSIGYRRVNEGRFAAHRRSIHCAVASASETPKVCAKAASRWPGFGQARKKSATFEAPYVRRSARTNVPPCANEPVATATCSGVS